MTDTREVPEINEETNLLILEKLIEIRKAYAARLHDPDINGCYHGSELDATILKDMNAVIKWVAAGGFE